MDGGCGLGSVQAFGGGQWEHVRMRECGRVCAHARTSVPMREHSTTGKMPAQPPLRRRKIELSLPERLGLPLGLSSPRSTSAPGTTPGFKHTVQHPSTWKFQDRSTASERLGLPPGLSSPHSRMPEVPGIAAQHQSAWDYPRV